MGRSSLPGDLGIWVDKSDRDQLLEKVRADGEAIGFETQLRRKDGTVITALESWKPLEIDGEQCLLVVTQDITERKLAEETLRASAAQNRALLQAIPDLIFMHDRDGKYLAIHAPNPNQLILPSETLLHRSVGEVLPDAIAKQFIQAIKNALASGTIQEVTYSLPMEGGEIYFEARVSPCTADTVITLVRDVTRRKMADQALRESVAENKALLNAIPDLIFKNQRNGEFQAVHAPDPGMLIVPPEAFLHRRAEEVLPEAFARRFVKAYEDALDLKAVQELSYTLPIDGEDKYFEARVAPCTEDTTITIVRDITERKQAEARLRESEEKFAKIYKMSPDAIDLTHSESGVMVEANQSCLRLFGYAREELLGHATLPSDLGIWVNQEARDRHIARVNEQGEDCDFEALLRRKDGSIFVCLISSALLEIGEERYNLSICRDITERINAENEIRNLNRNLEERVKDRTAQLEAANKEMEAFSYSVSHDLRAPLRGIDGFSQALAEDYQDRLDETGKHYISRIRAGTQRMGQLIDDLLLLSRVSRSEANRVKTDLSDLCRQVMEELTQGAPERRVEVTIQSGLSAWADRNLLKIALENLLRNAWKFTSKREDARIEVGELTSPSEEPVFFIRDNGAGFAMEHVGKLFAAFQRLHSTNEFEGTGIGLAIVQRIISRHDGRIWAEAEPGKGATFFFTLLDRGEA